MLAPGLLHGWGGPAGRSEAKMGVRTRDLDILGQLNLLGNAVQNIDFTNLYGTTANDMPLPPGVTVLRVTATNTVQIKGITGGYDGRLLIVTNVSQQDSGGFQVYCNSLSAQSGNRIMHSAASNQNYFVLAPGESMVLLYNKDLNNAQASTLGGHWDIIALGGGGLLNGDGSAAYLNVANTSGRITFNAAQFFVTGTLANLALGGTSSTPGSAVVCDPNNGAGYAAWGDLEPTPHYLFAR